MDGLKILLGFVSIFVFNIGVNANEVIVQVLPTWNKNNPYTQDSYRRDINRLPSNDNNTGREINDNIQLSDDSLDCSDRMRSLSERYNSLILKHYQEDIESQKSYIENQPNRCRARYIYRKKIRDLVFE